MLLRTNLRALSPGQWARTRIPDYPCWSKKTGTIFSTPVGGEVDICVIPVYGPRHDSANAFHWSYRVAYRDIGSSWPNWQTPGGSLWISTYDFGLKESTTFYWHTIEHREQYDGNGKWLYAPASDDHELCPGGDYSCYTCDKCMQVVTPFSDDNGDLVCPQCEVTGLIISDEETLDRLENAREFARQMGLTAQLERQLAFLDNKLSWGRSSQCVLSRDFAPHSFCFGHFQLPDPAEGRERRMDMNGGLIYQGPNCPADGSFPSLTVSLTSGTGWFCHT